jgi:hypothetical protein
MSPQISAVGRQTERRLVSQIIGARSKRHAEAALTARQFDVLDFVTLVGRRGVDLVDA